MPNTTHDDPTQLRHVSKSPAGYQDRYSSNAGHQNQKRPSFLSTLRKKLSRTESRKQKHSHTEIHKKPSRHDSSPRHPPNVEHSSHRNRDDSSRGSPRKSKIKSSKTQLHGSRLPTKYQIRHELNEATETDPHLLVSNTDPSSRPKSKRSNTNTTSAKKKKKSNTKVHRGVLPSDFLPSEYKRRHMDDVIDNARDQRDAETKQQVERTFQSPVKTSFKRTDELPRKSDRSGRHKPKSSGSSQHSVHVKSRGSSTSSKPHWWNHVIQPHQDKTHAQTPKQAHQSHKDGHSPHLSTKHAPHHKKSNHREKSRSSSTSSRPHWWNHKITGHTQNKEQRLSLMESQHSTTHAELLPVTGNNQSGPYHVSTKVSFPLTCDKSSPYAHTESMQQCKSNLKQQTYRKSTSVPPVKANNVAQYKFASVQSRTSSQVLQPRTESSNHYRPHTASSVAGIIKHSDNTSGIPLRGKQEKPLLPSYYQSHLRHQSTPPISPKSKSISTHEMAQAYQRNNVDSTEKLRAFHDISQSEHPVRDSDWSELEINVTPKYQEVSSFTMHRLHKENVDVRSYPERDQYKDDTLHLKHRHIRHDVKVPLDVCYGKKHLNSKHLRTPSSDTIRPQLAATSPKRKHNNQYVDERSSSRFSGALDFTRTPPTTIIRPRNHHSAKVSHRSTDSGIHHGDTSSIRPASNPRGAHQPSHDMARRNLYENETKTMSSRHTLSRCRLTSKSSRCSTSDAKSFRGHSVVAKFSSHSHNDQYNVKRSKSSYQDKHEEKCVQSRPLPLSSYNHSSLENKSTPGTNSDSLYNSNGDPYGRNRSKSRRSDYLESTRIPAPHIGMQSRYQVKSARSVSTYKVPHENMSGSNPLLPSHKAKSRHPSTAINKCKCQLKQDEKDLSSYNYPDPSNTRAPSSSLPGNASSTIYSRSSATTTQNCPQQHSRPSLATHKKTSLHTSSKRVDRKIVPKSSENFKSKPTNPRCKDVQACRKIFMNDLSTQSLKEEETVGDRPLHSISSQNTSCVCPQKEDGTKMADLLYNFVFLTHRLQELIKYQLVKIDAIEEAVAVKKVDLKFRRRNTKRVISSKTHPELYEVAATTLQDTKAQLLKELCAIKKNVAKIRNAVLLMPWEDIMNKGNFDNSKIIDGSDCSSRTVISSTTVISSRSKIKTRNIKVRTKRKTSSDVVSSYKTVTFTSALPSVTSAMPCSCKNNCSCWRSKVPSSSDRRNDVRLGSEDGIDAGDVALLTDALMAAARHIEECESFVNQIDPTLNENFGKVMTFSKTLISERGENKFCICDIGNKLRQKKPSVVHELTSTPQYFPPRKGAKASHGYQDNCYYPTLREKNPTGNVWDKVSSLMDAILDGDTPRPGPEQYSCTEGNNNSRVMDEVYDMGNTFPYNAARTGRAAREDGGHSCSCSEASQGSEHESKSKEKQSGSFKSNWTESKTGRRASTGGRAARASRRPSSIDTAVQSLLSFAAELAASVRSVESCRCDATSGLPLSDSVRTSGGGLTRRNQLRGNGNVAELHQPSDDQPLRLRQPPNDQPLRLRQPPDDQPLRIRQPPDDQPLRLRQPPDDQPLRLRQPPDDQPLYAEPESRESKIKVTTQSRRKIKLKVLMPRNEHKMEGRARQKIREEGLHFGKDSTEFCSCDSLIVNDYSTPVTTRGPAKTEEFCSCQSISVRDSRSPAAHLTPSRGAHSSLPAARLMTSHGAHAWGESAYNTCGSENTLMSSSSAAAPLGLNDAQSRDAATSQTEVYVLRRIEPDCLLIEWTVPPHDHFSGFDLYVDDVLAQRVCTALRFQTLLHGLDLEANHVITMVALSMSGGSARAQVTYNGGHRPYKSTRYSTCYQVS